MELMVNFREPVECFGLKVQMELDEDRNKTSDEKPIPTFEERGFYLTGEEPAFKAKVQNPGNRKREGIVVLTWRLGGVYMTTRPVGISLDPGETKCYEIQREWLVAPGIADYRLQLVVEPEDVLKKYVAQGEFGEGDLSGEIGFSQDFRRRIHESPVHTLCSFGIKERHFFKREQEIHEKRSSHQKWMKRLTVAIAILTAIYVLGLFWLY